MLFNPHGLNTIIESLTSQAAAKALYVSVMEWISPFSPRVTGKFHNDIYIFFYYENVFDLLCKNYYLCMFYKNSARLGFARKVTSC